MRKTRNQEKYCSAMAVPVPKTREQEVLLYECVWDLLYTIPEWLHSTVHYRLFEGETLLETGRVLGVTDSAVGHREKKAKRLLGHPTRARFLEEYRQLMD